MSTDGLPIDPRIPFYIPENWIEPEATGAGGQQFIRFPTAQTANCSFPGAILCSNLQSFAPTAPMNLFNNSTTGNIQIANTFGYTGGIVMSADGTAPVANTIRIGDSARPVVMPKVQLLDIEPIGAAGVFVNTDLTIANGSELFTNSIEKSSGAVLDIAKNNAVTVNLGTDTSRTLPINIGTNMTSAGSINLGGTLGMTNAPNLFVNTLNPITTPLKLGTTDYTIEIGRVASRITPISIGNLGLGDGTTTGSIFIGAGANSSTSSISLGSSSLENSYIRAKNLRLNDGANADSLIIGNSFTGNTVTVNAPATFNSVFKTNSVALVSGTTLTLPAATTTAPDTGDTSSRIVTSQWVRDQNFTTTAGFVTYSGAGPFTTLQSFQADIKTDSIQPYTAGANIDINSAVADAPAVGDNTARVPTANWVNAAITAALNATTLFAKLAGTAAFTALQTFNSGIKTNSIALVSGTSLTLPDILTNSIGLVSGSTLSLPAATTTAPADNDTGNRVVTSQWVRNQGYTDAAGYVTYAGAGPFTTLQTFNSGIKTDSIAVNTLSFLGLPASTTVTPIVPDNTTKVPTTSWVNTTIDNALNDTTLFAKLAGTLPFTTKQTFNAGIESTEVQGLTTTSTLSLGTNQTTGGAITLGSAASAVSIPSGLKIPSISSTTTAGTLSIGTDQIASGIINIGSAFTTMGQTALRLMTTVGIFGIGSPTVDLPIGNTVGNSSLSVTMCRKSITGTASQNVFKILSTGLFTPTSQYGELVISGQNPGAIGETIYTQKSSFVIQNSSVMAVSLFNVDKNYSSSGTNVTTVFSGFSATELRIQVSTPSSGTVTQNYIATLTMYPSLIVSSNKNFIIEAM